MSKQNQISAFKSIIAQSVTCLNQTSDFCVKAFHAAVYLFRYIMMLNFSLKSTSPLPISFNRSSIDKQSHVRVWFSRVFYFFGSEIVGFV